MPTRRHGAGAFAVALTALLLAACSSTDGGNATGGASQSGGQSKPYSLLMVGGFTGILASNANAQYQALQASADVVNANGGINGRKVTLAKVNDNGDATGAVSALQQYLAQNDQPDLVLAGTASTEAVPMVSVLAQQGILSMAQPGATPLNNPKQYPYHFGMTPPPPLAIGALVADFKKLGVKKLGALTSNDAYGTSVHDELMKNLQGSGIDVVSNTYSDADLDLTGPLQKVLAGNPDYLFLNGFGQPAGNVLNARLKLGATNIPAVGDLGISGSDLAHLTTPPALQNLTMEVFAIQQYVAEDNRPPNLKTMFNALKAHGDITQPLQTYSLTYDILQVVQAAAKQAGATDTKQVAKAIEELKAPAKPSWVTFPSYGWTADNHFPTVGANAFVFVRADGKVVDGMIQS